MYLSLAAVKVDVEFDRDGEFMIEVPSDASIKSVDDFRRAFAPQFANRIVEKKGGRIEDNVNKVSASIQFDASPKIQGNVSSLVFTILINQTVTIENGIKNKDIRTRIIENAIQIVVNTVLGKIKADAKMSADVNWLPLYSCLKYNHNCSNRDFVMKINCLESYLATKVVEDILPGSYTPKWSELSKTREVMGLPTDMYNLLQSVVNAPVEDCTRPYMRSLRLPIDNSSYFIDTLAKIFYCKNVLVSPNVYYLNTGRLNGDNSDLYDALSLLHGHIVVIDVAPLSKTAFASNAELMMIRGNQIRIMISDHPSIFFILRDASETTIVPPNVANEYSKRRDSSAIDILLKVIMENLPAIVDLKSYAVHMKDIRRCIKSVCMEIGRPEYTDKITRNLRNYMKKTGNEWMTTDSIYEYTKVLVGYEEHHVSRECWNSIDKEIMDNVNPGYLIEESRDNQPLKRTELTTKVKTKNNLAPMEELDKLVGLHDVKSIVKKLIAHYQFIGAHKEINNSAISNHMVFAGNPGTAKTTTARIMYNILVKAGRLKPDRFVEVGRQDLVGQYVGQTAPKVKEAFDRAIGGMLFVDEAYSLSIKNAGGFGEEAVATLVQEMENHRDDVIVILAGYKEEMEQMIHINPGLRSRISFTIDFPDYNADELVEITTSIASDMNYTISSDAIEYIRKKFSEEKLPEDLGNGRYARNLMEHAAINHSLRMMENESDTDYTVLSKEDFENAWKEVYKPKKTHKTGF